ncbi:GNAT family N-acetyltransferase [Salinisphaera sp. LB1]|uniref:GNAT family N-acetyltransferase n=1 Tax=Salinisphaera sp. LB1 TaxID=2183911 RepID=UPI0018F700FF|nr:GNAT family N-acetyltransferase [Salinisphaera sp. LB1]
MSESRFSGQWLRDMPATAWHEIVVLREAVFVVEQACAYQETDAHDLVARHFSLRIDNALAGYLRIVPGAIPAIGRVLIAPAFRGRGLGYRLMNEGLLETYWLCGDVAVSVSAQAHLRDFYQRLGFVVISDVYLEDGIPHCAMQRQPGVAARA